MGTYVSLAHRRQGIGRLLSEVTFGVAREKGYDKIFTYVRADNPESLAYHVALGFRVVGTARDQARVGSGLVDEVIIELFL